MGTTSNFTYYWMISKDDYDTLTALLGTDSPYASLLTDFGLTSPYYPNVYFADLSAISEDEMDFLNDLFEEGTITSFTRFQWVLSTNPIYSVGL